MLIFRNCRGLVGSMPGFEPQARHQKKIRKVFVFLQRFSLSRFLAKTLKASNKSAMKKFLKKSVVPNRI